MPQRLYFHPIAALFFFGIALMPAIPSSASVSDTGNPGGDEPDESAFLGDALYPTKLEEISPRIDAKSKVAVLDNGYGREAALFFGLYLPVRVVQEADLPAQSSSISLLIIPSGGLSPLNDPERFRMALGRFVEEGGMLFIFSQRFGKDYALFPLSPGDSIQGYGWLEGQSSLPRSATLAMRHPAVAGLTASRSNLNIDGAFTVYPRNGKPLLRNSVSGQPVMLAYKYGRGSVIASALFTDWAYPHLRATWDEIALFSKLLKWAGLFLSPSAPKRQDRLFSAPLLPEALPVMGFSVQSDHEVYEAGETATFSINLWNYEDRKRTLHVFYDGTGHEVQLPPHGFAQLTHSVPVYSTRRLWVYFHDEHEIFLQTLKKGYTVVYPVNEEK
ncbi:MAG: hypothetical protein HZB32_00715 [Nitrospirae bacterium]|nr:hypothetical protein [Nitrospirota bacterium]